MTCIKTGCHIYVIPLGIFAYGDAHQLGDVTFFRLVSESRGPLQDILHFEVNTYRVWWDRHLTVSNLMCLTADIILYGRSISEFTFT